jgi:hypothetical protein
MVKNGTAESGHQRGERLTSIILALVIVFRRTGDGNLRPWLRLNDNSDVPLVPMFSLTSCELGEANVPGRSSQQWQVHWDSQNSR